MNRTEAINQLIQEVIEKTSLTGEHFYGELFDEENYQPRFQADTESPWQKPDCDNTDYVVGEHHVTIWDYSSDFREGGLSKTTITHLDELLLNIFTAEIWHIKVLAPLYDTVRTKIFSLSKQIGQGELIEKRLRYRLLKALFFSRRFWRLKKQMRMGLKYIKVGQMIQSFFALLATLALVSLFFIKPLLPDINLFYPAAAVSYVFLFSSIIRLGDIYDNRQAGKEKPLLLSQKIGMVLALTFPLSVIALKGFELNTVWEIMTWGHFALLIVAIFLFYQKK